MTLFPHARHTIVLALKRMFYFGRGEPFRVRGRTLRYLPGTRPVRARYARSPNANVRYDALQVRLFSEQLSEGDTAIDIGAHCGQYSLLMAAMCGKSGRVIAFEPDPHARQRFRLNLKLNPQLPLPTLEDCALADVAGEASLYSRGGNSQSSLVRAFVETGGHASEEIRVPVTTLDGYLSRRNVPEPRWVKIDVEGAEIRILRGATRLLSGNAGIVCELHPYAWPEFGNTFDELRQLAAAAGRRVRYLDQDADAGDRPEYGTVVLERAP